MFNVSIGSLFLCLDYLPWDGRGPASGVMFLVTAIRQVHWIGLRDVWKHWEIEVDGRLGSNSYGDNHLQE